MFVYETGHAERHLTPDPHLDTTGSRGGRLSPISTRIPPPSQQFNSNSFPRNYPCSSAAKQLQTPSNRVQKWNEKYLHHSSSARLSAVEDAYSVPVKDSRSHRTETDRDRRHRRSHVSSRDNLSANPESQRHYGNVHASYVTLTSRDDRLQKSANQKAEGDSRDPYRASGGPAAPICSGNSRGHQINRYPQSNLQPNNHSAASPHSERESPLRRNTFHTSSSFQQTLPVAAAAAGAASTHSSAAAHKQLYHHHHHHHHPIHHHELTTPGLCNHDKDVIQMRSQPDLSCHNLMTSSDMNHHLAGSAVSVNRSSAVNIHQGVLHSQHYPTDERNNTQHNLMSSSCINNGGTLTLGNNAPNFNTQPSSAPGISVVAANAKLGLSSKQALERLFHEVNNELQEFSKQQSLKRSVRSFWRSLPFHYHHKLSTLRLHEFLFILVSALSLLFCYLMEPSLGGTLVIEAMGILILLFLSSLISWWDIKLQTNDMFTRAQHLLDNIQETLLFMQQQSTHSSHPALSPSQSAAAVSSHPVWNASLYPNLHAPVSPSVSLQWSHRDHQLVNLPANLLVRGDVVQIRPGQTVFARVKQLQTSKSDPLGLVLNPGETYNPLEGQADDPCPSARLHSPMDRLACVVQETPFVAQLRKCLQHSQTKKRSAWDNRRYAVLDLIELKFLPVAVLTGLFVNGVLYIKLGNFVGHHIEMYLLHQVYILIPLVPLLFPVLWLMWTALVTASLLAFCQQQGCVVRGEAVGGVWHHFKFSWRHFISIISGMSPTLSRTSNLLYGLGATTIFSVVDKRGVLSYPNPKVERVFFIRPVEQPDDVASPAESVNGRLNEDQDSDNASLNAVYVPEVMDLSCDTNENFFVHFDDERWQQHLPSLKPLGLNILLNTCNQYVEDSYTKFADHLLCVSSLENHSIAVVNRRCACELSEAIGFAKNATESYEVKNYIQSFRESQPFDPSDTFKVRRIKAILRKKTPFPFLCSVVVHDTSTGLQQLFTQGTADMLCDVCPDFWDGRGIHPLSPELRKKIHDFYTRASLSAYCTAFAYRPVFSDFSKVLDNFYLELPGGKNALSELENVHSTDFVSDAKGLAKAQSGQIFLGMVVMQYKAMPDVVDLIEDCEARCIRFVHFSHENELRSRIFAEKLGLETGWNCHVSLFASTPATEEHHSSQHSSKAASLTTLRSFAQNVIQANEKLKTLQSQTNIDTASNPNEGHVHTTGSSKSRGLDESISTPASPAVHMSAICNSRVVSHSVGPTMQRVERCNQRVEDDSSRDPYSTSSLGHKLGQGQRSQLKSQSHVESEIMGPYHSQKEDTSALNESIDPRSAPTNRADAMESNESYRAKGHNLSNPVPPPFAPPTSSQACSSSSTATPPLPVHTSNSHQRRRPSGGRPNPPIHKQMSSASLRHNHKYHLKERKVSAPVQNIPDYSGVQCQCHCLQSTSRHTWTPNAIESGVFLQEHKNHPATHRAQFNPLIRQNALQSIEDNSSQCGNPACLSENCFVDLKADVGGGVVGVGVGRGGSDIAQAGVAESLTSGICSISSDEGVVAVTTSSVGLSVGGQEVQLRNNNNNSRQQHSLNASLAARKYAEKGVQTQTSTPGTGKDEYISFKDDEAGLDEMFSRLEKLEQTKRQSQEEVALVNGMNCHSGKYGPSPEYSDYAPWEQHSVAVDTRADPIMEQDEFVSLPPMSPGSMSETSSGAVSPLPNSQQVAHAYHTTMTCLNSHSRGGNVGNSASPPQPPMMPSGNHIVGQRGHSLTDPPSAEMSGSGNSPVEYCYQCSTLNNSNVLLSSSNSRVVVPGHAAGGIESQCSSIESNCINVSHNLASSAPASHFHRTQPDTSCKHACCSQGSVIGAKFGSYCTRCNHVCSHSNNHNPMSHHSSSNTLISSRAKSPSQPQPQNHLNATSIRSNPVGRKQVPPPVPVRRYATLTGAHSQIEPSEATESLLNSSHVDSSMVRSHSRHSQPLLQSEKNHRLKSNLSRTGSLNSQANHLHDDAVSRTSETSFGLSSLAGSEGVMFDDLYDLSNRAKLPRGVENIRPHLEHVDNVPLLVPLFTDCTPEATKEMVTIMQENSEVVCVYGSSLNVTNIDIFLQSDVSIGVMPYVPQPCVRHPVCFEPYLPDGRHLTPLGLASALGSLPCSLHILRNVSLTNIFHSASRLSENLKTALFFLLSCHLTIILTQILSAVCFQPPPFSGSLILWLVGFILPLLASSLLANPACPNAQQWTVTQKNVKKILKTDVREFLIVFAMRFLPTCLVLPLMEIGTLYTMCLFATKEENCLLSHGNINSTEVWNGYRGSYRGALVIAQNLSTWLLVVHICFISASFVFPKSYIWRRAPLRNVVWAITCPLIIALQLFYLLSDVQSYSASPFTLSNTPGYVWIFGLVWAFIALLLSEIVKVYETRKAFTKHRRCKLQFGTKLGMNSPF